MCPYVTQHTSVKHAMKLVQIPGNVLHQGSLRTYIPAFISPGISLCKTPLLTSYNEIVTRSVVGFW